MSINLSVQGNTQPLEAAVQAAVNRIRRTPIRITVDDKGATQPLGNMKRGADEFTKSMEAANARIIAFGASMAIINGVSDAFKGMVRNVVEVEKSLADINVVMGLSAKNLDQFSDGLFKVAKETGQAFKVAADAATEYARQGLGVEESLKRTRDALVLTRLTGMDSAEAVKALTAAMNTYGSQIKDTTQLVSKFAAVDVQFAVSAEDFADSISRTGQAAKSAGVDINELVGIVTSAQQQTARGGKVIGNALKTIFTRLGTANTLNELESIGVAVRDLEGNTLGATRILKNLAGSFDQLSDTQQTQTAKTVAGVYQINILKAILSDAAKQNSILSSATKISSSATDEAIQKNEMLRSTMSAMASETGSAIKQVSSQIGELMLAPGMEKILNTVKSFTESIGGLLGSGENEGNKFATGFLKGLGNVITGPGLVVLTTVFFKLFGQAVKFTRESLNSLIGITTEAQKQKAIQTSLVSLFGQNASLSKEMLRTDISRTEKEKIILGLLRAQVAEANSLNAISKQAASTLYTQGFGANLTPRRRGRADGHIPNYANPERVQAAQGGYAAGNIRSMNMPGEGSVIYNSAEKVKNFKGMSQPAIMPPHSSKAGKNYQQAFGNIHGFDPYAAGGYIPNFAKKTASKTSDIPRNLNSKKLGDLNKDSSLILLTADSSADSESRFFVGKDPKGGTKILNTADLASKRTTGYYQVDVPYYSLDKNDKSRKSKTDLPSIQKAITAAASGKALDIAKQIVGGEKNLKPFNREQIKETFNKGAFKGAAGSAFESAIAAALDSYLFQDYEARTDTSAIDLPYDPKVFQYFGAPPGAGKMGAEVKADLANNLQQGAANKFYQVLAGGRAAWQYKDKNFKDQMRGSAEDAGLERRGGAYFKKGRAYGHIPNFADPLSDAIGREKSAGVPVSQIRVGSHGALMGKGNPLGLGVTNTHDEPNGLKDVFGAANGFVPNYAPPQISASDITGYKGRSAQAQMDENAKKYNKVLKRSIKDFKEGHISKKTLNQRTKDLGQRYHVSTQAQQNVEAELKKSTASIKNLNTARKRASNILSTTYSSARGGVSALNTKFGNTALGKGLGSTGGQMGLMMGAPILAGLLQGEGPGKVSDTQYQAGGALMGVGTGAAMGMMFGPLGAAIGGVVGGFSGLLSASEDLKEAQEKAAKAERESSIQTGAALAQSLAPSLAKTDFGKSGEVEFSFGGRRQKIDVDNFNNLSAKDPSKGGGFGMKMGADFRSKMLEQSGVNIGDLLKFGFPGARKAAGKNKKYQASGAASAMKKILESKGLTGAVTSEDFLKEALTTTAYNLRGQKAGVKMEDSAKATKEIEDQILAQMGSAARPEAIKAALDQLPKDMKIQTTALKGDVTAGGRAFKEGDLEYFTPEELKKQIDSGDITQVAKAYADILKQIEIQRATNEENNKAVILQLNAQRAIVTAQQEAREIQFNIKSSYAEIGSSLSLQAKIMGNFATEQQKAQLDYTKAINKATQSYVTGAQSEQGKYRQDMLAFSKNDNIASALKTSLARKSIVEQAVGEGDMFGMTPHDEEIEAKAKKIDLTKELIKLSNEELYAELKKANLSTKQLQTLEDYKNSKEKNVGLLLKELSLSSKIAQNEFKINDAIGRRKDIVSSMKGASSIVEQSIKSRQESRNSKASIDAARRLTAFGPGFKTGKEQEAFQMNEKRITLENKIKKIREDSSIVMSNQQTALAAILLEESRISELKDKDSLSKEGGKQLTTNEQNELDSLLKIDAKRTVEKIRLEMAITRTSSKLKEDISHAETILALEKQRLKEKRKHETGFGGGFRSAQGEMKESVEDFDTLLGKTVAVNFRDGIAEAMKVGLNGADNLGDALMNIAGNFLSAIQNAFLQNAANAIVSSIPMPGVAKTATKYRGGAIRNYSQGGEVPAMVTNGEYVMSRGAVNKYGGSFMHGMNAGGNIPKFSNGGAAPGSAIASDFGGGRGVASGRAYQSKAMSGFFYSQSGNVGIGEDRDLLLAELAEEEKARQAAAAKKAKRKAFYKQILGTALSAGISYGMAGGFSKAPTVAGGSPDPAGGTRSFDYNYLGGSIRKYASGGHISGKSGIDQIPAMLSEGEYVIRASSARQIGKPMLDQINAGKFNNGGAVAEIAGSEQVSSSGGNTNNISISINMEKGSKEESKEEGSSGKNPVDASSEDQGNSALADRIKQQVVAVIVEEQRPGGLLDEKS